MVVPNTIIQLIERFDFYRDSYLKSTGTYNEAKLRNDYLDPFFKAMGWDVDNKNGWSETYREVSHEQTIKIRGRTEFIDYSFRIGGLTKFIVEAKAPSIRIRDNRDAALQVRRYAWNAKQPLCILTNFDEFAVYNCIQKPTGTDSAVTGRIEYFTYKEYPQKWEEIITKFTKESILTGIFDEYANTTKGKKGTVNVDDSFLTDIEEWRINLARNIELRNRNPPLNIDELNFSVQSIIDRIIFLRICEDRDIEVYETLKSFRDGNNVYQRLCEYFKKADKKYNSGLFHFEKEVGREKPDTLTTDLNIDDKIVKKIIKSLYFPDSPYEFSVISPEILGHVYEQFLGKVIRLTEKYQVKVEEKTEVKKAGGVYYTPQYIVDYIVKNTIEKYLKNKTPKEISSLAILDPASGSGSFLLGAYQCLLDWHLEYYTKNLAPLLNLNKSIIDPEVLALLPEKKNSSDKIDFPIYNAGYSQNIHSRLLERRRSDWKLTTTERKRILINNIYGVDIDHQAVEVTKLSLLLKVLEEENEETIKAQITHQSDRALPSLHRNIKCGNSLIEWDILDTQSVPPDIVKKINPFNWETEFSEIMQNGGFDVVIGNPPWGADFSKIEQNYIKQYYKVGTGRNLDSYIIFIEAGLRKIKNNGIMGFITPDTFLRKDDHLPIRSLLLNDYTINELIETGPVFSKVRDTWALVFSIQNQKPRQDSKIKHKNLNRFIVSTEERLERFGKSRWDNDSEVHQALWKSNSDQIIGYLASEKHQQIIKKIELNPRLSDLKDLFLISRGEEGSKFSLQEDPKGSFFIVIPNDIEKNNINPGLRISESDLTPNKINKFYIHPKIWCIRIQKMRWKQRLVSAFDERINSAGMKTLQLIVSVSDDIKYLKYLQGILSSILMNYYLVNYLADDLNKSYLEKIPIRKIDFTNEDDLKKCNKMVDFVTQIIDLNIRIREITLEHEKTIIQRQIEAINKQINNLVFELYELTEEEIETIKKYESFDYSSISSS